MKLQNTIFLVVVLVILLTSCFVKTYPTLKPSLVPSITFSATTTSTVTTSSTLSLNPTNTSIPTRQPPTVTSTYTPHPTSTITPTIQPKVFQDHCLEVATSLPQDLKSDGVIVMYDLFTSTPKYLFDMKTGQKNILSEKEGENIQYLNVSSDRKWLAYWSNRNRPAQVTLKDSWLVIATSEGKPYKLIPWEEGWRYIAGWLSNEQVLINKKGKGQYELDSMIVLNPFTGQRTELTSNYPKIDDLDWISWNFSRTVYNPSLSLVIYPFVETGHSYMALWDKTNNKRLASVPAALSCSPEPSWSPDGKQVILTGLTSTNAPYSDWCNQELYSINWDGQVTRLTYFTDIYPKFGIGDFSWSPDGQRVAFWFRAEPGPYNNQQLAVLDVGTGGMTNYCVPGFLYGSAGPPVWSPDGQQLAVQNLYDDQNDSHTILVDLVNGWAARIAEGLSPVGWMESP